MIKLTLTQEELSAMAGLMDLGVKAGGISVVKTAASLLEKLEAAVAEANASKPAEETE